MSDDHYQAGESGIVYDRYLPTKMTMTTLGDPVTSLTCSTHVARRRFPEYHLTGVSAFEDGADLVAKGEVETLLVPAAYPQVNGIINDPRLELNEAFIFPIPEIVLASVSPIPRETITTLYLHPATRTLLHSALRQLHLIEVNSNEVAGQRLVNDKSGAALAVTNRLVADALGLHIHEVLRPPKPMAWLVLGTYQK